MTTPLVICQRTMAVIPLTVGWIAYAGCHHIMCQRCAGRDWRTRPEPKSCPVCREMKRYQSIHG